MDVTEQKCIKFKLTIYTFQLILLRRVNQEEGDA